MRIADQKKSNQKHLDVGSLKPKQKHLMAQTWPRLEGWKPVSSRPSSSWQTSSTSCPTEERPRDTWFKNSIWNKSDFQFDKNFHLLGRVSDQRSSSNISLFQPIQANPKNLIEKSFKDPINLVLINTRKRSSWMGRRQTPLA